MQLDYKGYQDGGVLEENAPIPQLQERDKFSVAHLPQRNQSIWSSEVHKQPTQANGVSELGQEERVSKGTRRKDQDRVHSQWKLVK